MGTGYTRNDTTNNIADGNVINAADLDGEFDAIVTALSTGGHTHDGTAAEGGPVTVLGPAQDFVVTASIVSPKTDNTLDLGTSTLEFKDLYIDGTAHIDTLDVDENAVIIGDLSVGGDLTVTGTTTFNGGTITMGDAASDNVVFGADVNSSIIPNGADNSFDLGSSSQQWRDIYINGSAYIDGLAEDILVATDKKIQFRDTGLFINSSTNGQLDIDADVELEITAPTVDINASTAVLISNDLKLDSDAAILSFGASSEITITHVADTGLTLTHTGTSDNTPIILQLKSEENELTANEIIASIEFAAGDDSGTDAATVAAGIHAIAEAEFTSTANATKLVFTTGASETAAASATAKMTLSSAGLLTIADDFMLKDGGTIGVASTNDAITIASTGIVTFKDDILIKDAGTIGSASDPDAIAISSAGVVAISSTTAASSSTSGALTVAGGVGIAADLHVGNDFVVTGDATFNGDTNTFASGNSADPILIIKNTNSDASGSRLRFTKDKGAVGADGDDIGTIEFVSDNVAQEQTSFASILAEVSESADTDEAGKLSFFVSESNGTSAQLTAGLVIEGEHATDGQVDVTIAAGTASTTTVAGDLAVTTDATVGGTLDTTGAVNLNLVTDSTSSTSGALIVDGGVGIAKKLFVGTDLDVSGDAVIDGTALVTGVLTTTAATVFNGGFVANDGSTITTADNTTQLTLASTDTDANVGPVLDLFRNVTGATNDEIGRIQFTGKNDAGTDHTYANISSNIVDATSSGNTEDGSLVFQTIVAGSVRDRLNILSDQIVINQEGRDLDFRVESDGNANMLFVDGENDAVVIGHNDATNGTFASGQRLQMVGTDFVSSSFGLSRFSADGSGPSISLSKSRAAGIGTDTVVQDNDELGSIIFTGADGTDLATQGAIITAAIDGTPGGNDMPTRLTFATTGDGNSSPTERMRIDNSGNLLVKKTSTNGAAVGGEIRATGLGLFTADGTNSLQVRRLSDDGDLIEFYKDGNKVGSIATQGDRLSVGSGDSNLNFNASANSMYPISNPTTGALSDGVIELGAATARFKNFYLSGGVFLGGTGDANKLDDYEEGTWTPAAAGLSLSSVSANYTKIGDMVHYGFTVTLPTTTATTHLKFTGLPFSVGTDIFGGSLIFTNSSVTAVQAVCVSATNDLQLYKAGSAFATYADFNGSIFRVSGAYKTDA